MPGRKIEDELGKNISNFIESIPRYFKTLWFVLIHPKKTFNNLSIKENTSSFTRPETFLGINIILSISIWNILGYNIPKYPLQPLWLDSPFTDLIFSSIRVLLGILVYLFLIKWLIGYRSNDSFIKKAFPVLCYCSALYVVYIIVHGFYGWFLGDYFLKLINKLIYIFQQSKFDENLIIALFDRKTVVYLLALILPLLIFLWWFLLAYYGFKSLNISSPKRTMAALVLGIIIFFMINQTAKIIQIRYINASMLKCIHIMKNTTLDKEISGGHSAWYDAAFDANIVAENNMVPEAVRYRFLIKKLTFMISLPIYKNDKRIVTTIMDKLKQRKYEEIENILSDNIKNISSGLTLEDELKKAKNLRQSPDYFKLYSKSVSILPIFVRNPVPLSPDLEIIAGEKFLLLPFIKSEKIISIFP